MIHFLLMYLAIFLSYLMKYTRHNFIQYLDVLKAIIVFVINCLELSTAQSMLARKHYRPGERFRHSTQRDGDGDATLDGSTRNGSEDG